MYTYVTWPCSQCSLNLYFKCWMHLDTRCPYQCTEHWSFNITLCSLALCLSPLTARLFSFELCLATRFLWCTLVPTANSLAIQSMLVMKAEPFFRACISWFILCIMLVVSSVWSLSLFLMHWKYRPCARAKSILWLQFLS